MNGMSFTEIEIEAEGITLKIKRQAKEAKRFEKQSNSIEEFGGFSQLKKSKHQGLRQAVK